MFENARMSNISVLIEIIYSFQILTYKHLNILHLKRLDLSYFFFNERMLFMEMIIPIIYLVLVQTEIK